MLIVENEAWSPFVFNSDGSERRTANNPGGFVDSAILHKALFDSTNSEPAEKLDRSAAVAVLEIGKNTCTAMQRFLIMIMELDLSKKTAEMQGSTNRADGIRTPLLEILLFELTYNEDALDSFLQVFNEPKWKLEVVVQYLWKYIGKPSVRTRRSNGPLDDTSFMELFGPEINSSYWVWNAEFWRAAKSNPPAASGQVIRKYFRQKFDVLDKDDSSPVTIADRTAEEHMFSILSESFPSHAIYGEENGWRCKEAHADYVWVLDPIDGTKSFITGKPVFGTLIALLLRGKPILGIIDQPILKERWLGISGRETTLNGKLVSTRTCTNLSQAYLYTTSPHLFSAEAEEAFVRVRDKVKVPSYGCDCYAYALLASGYVDLVVESGLKPYDFLSLIPVIEGAGGVITDWKGDQLHWEASANSHATSFNVVAAGDKQIHQQALNSLQWQ